MPSVQEALVQAVAFHQAGQLPQAEQIYRQVLQADPRNADAWHLLGVIGSQVDQHEAAVEYIRRAIELNPNSTAFHANLGAAYQKLKRFDEAVACYRRALELNPNNPEAHNNLGVAFQSRGDPATAEACFRRALAHNPDYAEAHSNLGNVLQALGKPAEALACHQRAAELKPAYAEAHHGIGAALKELGRVDEAIAACRRALELKENSPETHNDLGVALMLRDRFDEAAAAYRRALELKPDYAEAHTNLGNTLREQGRLDEAMASHQRALELKPDFAEARFNLGNVLKEQGEFDEALACYRRALELKPDFADARHNLLFSLQYRPGITLAELAEAHAEFERRHAAPLRSSWPAHGGEKVAATVSAKHPEGRSGKRWLPPFRPRSLRLGFVSHDFCQHPVGFFLIRAVENLDRREAEIVCYNDRGPADVLTSRFQAAASLWRDVLGWSHQRLAAQIREDKIDILFDLAGHTAHNRLLVFARKPAPIQVTWAGYVGTTGLKAMDYLLADRYEVPPGAEPYYQERVLRMPDGYVCYDPPAYAPAVAPLPALARDPQAGAPVTFGCFNNPAKITPQVIEVWAKILRRLPTARLVLKYKGLNQGSVARRFAEMFAAQAIDPGRLELLGASPHAELLAEYNRIDLALDPFPYSGGLTTCEALWMGVPVVTCPGETFASRHSLSHLSNAGLTETIAGDMDEYVELAVSLASDLPRLAAIRAGLRQRMAASPLCDGKRFATNLMSMLHEVY